MREFRRAAEKQRKKALKEAAREQIRQRQRAPQPVSIQRSTTSWAYVAPEHKFAWSDEVAAFCQPPKSLPARIAYVAKSKKLAAFTGTISATISIAVLVRWLLGI